MGGGTDAAIEAVEGTLGLDLSLHDGIEAEGDEETKEHHEVELEVDGGATAVGDEPTEHDEEVGGDDGQGGAYVGVAELYIEVVEVGLVGVEGGLATDHAGTHHAQGVEDGDAQHSKGEGDEAEGALMCDDIARRGGEQGGDEHGEDDAEREGAGIADEHLGVLAKDVVKEEGEQRGGYHGGKDDHLDIAQGMEHETEEETADDAVA